MSSTPDRFIIALSRCHVKMYISIFFHYEESEPLLNTLTDLTIRNATLADLKAITAIEAECFPAAEAAGEASFQKRLSVYPSHFWLLCDADTIIGFVNGMITDEADLTDEMYDHAELHDELGGWQMIFGVDTIPAWRRKGCAAMLLQKVSEDAESQHRLGLVLTCKEQLIHYYEKFGFVNEGISESVHGNVTWYQMRITF